jgi:hypothetical protein
MSRPSYADLSYDWRAPIHGKFVKRPLRENPLYEIVNKAHIIYFVKTITSESLEKYMNLKFSRDIIDIKDDKAFIMLLIEKLYDNSILNDDKSNLKTHKAKLIAQFSNVLPNLDKYLIYLCNLVYYLYPNRLYLLKRNKSSYQQTNMDNHLFYPKLYNNETIDFWMNFALDLNDNKPKTVYKHPNLTYSKICNTYDHTIIIKDKTIDWNDTDFVNSPGKFNYEVDRFLHSSFIRSGKKTVKEYLLVIKDEYLKILEECTCGCSMSCPNKTICPTNVSCLSGLIQKSYMSNISEITSMDKICDLLISYHNEYYKFYRRMPTQNILPFWRIIFEQFIKSNHTSLFKEPANYDYTQDVDFKKFTYNTDIAKILDTYEIGVKSYIYKFMPTPIQYIVLFLTSSKYNRDIKYKPELKDNVVEINDCIIKFIGDNYKNRINFTKSIIENFSKVYFYLNQNCGAVLKDKKIIQDTLQAKTIIPLIETSDNSIEIDYNKYYKQHKTEDDETNFELLYHKIKIHQKIYDLIADFLYINAQSHIHALEKNVGMVNFTNKTLAFGHGFLLKKYGFKDVSYVYKISSDQNFGFSDLIRWTLEQNTISVMNFAKTEKLISGVFLIDDESMPCMYFDFLDDRDIKFQNLKLIETIEITLPLSLANKPKKQNLESKEQEQEQERNYYTHHYYIFFDTKKEIIVILNSRGRVVYPGEILETYAITYRELNILYSYNCNFYRCKKEEFSFLYLVSPAEYSQRLPEILQKLKIYDKFVKDFEPVFIVKDRINTKALIIVKKNLELVSYPETYKELYMRLKKIGNIEFKKSINDHLPFHSQVCS